MIAAFVFAGFLVAAHAEDEKKVKPPTNVVVTVTVTPAAPGPAASDSVTDSPDVASASWTDIKDYTYDMRAQFFAGLKRLETKVDRQVSELTAKRAAINNATGSKEWDLAMTEMINASSSLKLMGEELSRAIPEKWTLQKYMVGRAWTRTQDAYAKVQSIAAP